MKRKLLLILSSLIITSVNAQKLKFTVWGDTQFQNPEIFETFIEKTNLLNPEFVIHVGDMIHGYTYSMVSAAKQWERFKHQINPLQVPFYPTPGNHDVTTKEILEAYADAWNQHDKFYYSFEIQNNLFVVLNAFENQDFYVIGDSQFNWLKNTLENTGSENIFVSLHPPMHLSHKENWEKIHKLLVRHNVRAVFTGHAHIYDYRNIDGIDYFCLNTSGHLGGYENHLAGKSRHILQVEVNDDKINYAVFTEDNIYPHNIVHPDERKRAGKYFEPDKSIRLNPQNTIVDTTVNIEFVNRSLEERTYSVNWDITSNDWEILPYHKDFTIPANSSIYLPFSIISSTAEFKRTNMPYLVVQSPYKTLNGINTYSEHKISLFVPPTTAAYKINDQINIDGDLNESSWNVHEFIDEMYIDVNGTPAKESTTVIVLYDSNNIYVGIKGEEPNPGGLSALAYGDIPLVFADDDFELFFDTNNDMKSFYRLMVNPKGTTLSSGPGGLFSYSFDVTTHIGKDYWSAEFLIPFDQINTNAPSQGDYWGFNVRRHRQQADQPQSDWSKMNTHPPYQPEYFGLLIFR